MDEYEIKMKTAKRIASEAIATVSVVRAASDEGHLKTVEVGLMDLRIILKSIVDILTIDEPETSGALFDLDDVS